jgi:hypothetical protein
MASRSARAFASLLDTAAELPQRERLPAIEAAPMVWRSVLVSPSRFSNEEAMSHRSQINYRIPAEEKQDLYEEAARHGISASALQRINNIQARAWREREEIRERMYPQKVRNEDL